MTFGENLRKCRKAKGITQSELAQKVGLGLNTIINYEGGRTYPKDRNVYVLLAEVLEVNVNELKNENDDFVSEAKEIYGARGAIQAEELIKDAHALFAGGELSEADKENVMMALQEAYWLCKKENREKYGRKHSQTE